MLHGMIKKLIQNFARWFLAWTWGAVKGERIELQLSKDGERCGGDTDTKETLIVELAERSSQSQAEYISMYSKSYSLWLLKRARVCVHMLSQRELYSLERNCRCKAALHKTTLPPSGEMMQLLISGDSLVGTFQLYSRVTQEKSTTRGFILTCF